MHDIIGSVAVCPPLIITEEQIDELLRRCARTLEDCHAELGTFARNARIGA